MPEIARALSDPDLRAFAEAVSVEEAYRTEGIEGVDWDAVLSDLAAEVESRPGLRAYAVELDWRRAAARIAAGEYDGARALLDDVRARATAEDGRLGWIESSLAQVAVSQERWSDALAHLDAADAERADVRDAAHFGPWLDGLRAELWILIGMPELAAEWMEERWSADRVATDPFQRWSGFELRSRYLMAANDYAELGALERFVRAAGWLDGWHPQQRAGAERRFATALAEEGQYVPTANAEARRRLPELLADPALSAPDRTWGWIALVLALLDAGELQRAGVRVQELGAWLRERGEADSGSHPDAAVRVALEGLVAVARYDAGELDAAALAPRLSDVREAWEALRVGWSNTPTRDGGLGYLLLGSRQVLVEALLALAGRCEGPERGARVGFDWLLEAQAESTLTKRLGAAPCTFESVRAGLLAPGRGLLAWVPSRARSFVLVADSERMRILEIAALDVLTGSARELVGAVQRAILEPSAEARAALEQALERAGAHFLPAEVLELSADWSSCYVLGLDDAGFVPIEMLEGGGGRSLGSRMAVARLPSLPVGLELVRRARAESSEARGSVVALGADGVDPEVAARFGVQPLEIADALFEPLLAPFERSRASELRGGSASLASLRSAPGGARDLWHLVAHGVQRQDERPPGLLLAPADGHDGAVFAEEVEALDAPGLVELSVCGAARSRLRPGDGGRHDLAAAFFLAGAQVVTSTATDLDLAPALRVGAEVHRGLVTGLSPAEALRRARAVHDAPGGRADGSGTAGRLGRDWLAAHALRASGAAFDWTARVGVAGAPTAPWSVGRTAALVGLIGAMLGLVIRSRRRRPRAAR